MVKRLLCLPIAAVLATVAVHARAQFEGDLAPVPDSTVKVCQLTGDNDLALGVPTLSRTGERFGLLATDLGSSFEHRGRLYFLFGDTIGRPGDRDVLAWTTARDPAKIRLDCPTAPDGKWLPLTVPGISQGAYEVPSGGVSVGGHIVVAFTTDHTEAKIMGRSVLAESADDGRTFRVLYDLSTNKFINVSFWPTRDWLYLFGSGTYRKSSVFLARIRPGEIHNRAALLYYTGNDANHQPHWSASEEEATPLFRHDVVGEFSVSYCKPVHRYVMLYNSSEPRGITMRSAETPWGTWSDGTTLFEPWRDHGYGHFIHISNTFSGQRDSFSDPHREAEWGGEYGPFIMSRFTHSVPGGCRIYFTMSTWNPYQVIVMHTDLQSIAAFKPGHNAN